MRMCAAGLTCAALLAVLSSQCGATEHDLDALERQVGMDDILDDFKTQLDGLVDDIVDVDGFFKAGRDSLTDNHVNQKPPPKRPRSFWVKISKPSNTVIDLSARFESFFPNKDAINSFLKRKDPITANMKKDMSKTQDITRSKPGTSFDLHVREELEKLRKRKVPAPENPVKFSDLKIRMDTPDSTIKEAFQELAVEWMKVIGDDESQGGSKCPRNLPEVTWDRISKDCTDRQRFVFWWFRKHFINDLARAVARKLGVHRSVIMYDSAGSATLTSDVDYSLKGIGMTQVSDEYAETFRAIWGSTSDEVFDNNLYASNFFDPLPPTPFSYVAGKFLDERQTQKIMDRTIKFLGQPEACTVQPRSDGKCTDYSIEDSNQVVWAFAAVVDGLKDCAKAKELLPTSWAAPEESFRTHFGKFPQAREALELWAERDTWEGELETTARGKCTESTPAEFNHCVDETKGLLVLRRYDLYTKNVRAMEGPLNEAATDSGRLTARRDYVDAISSASYYGIEAMYTHGGMMHTVFRGAMGFKKVRMTTAWLVEAMLENGGRALHDIGKYVHKGKPKNNSLRAWLERDGIIKASKYLKRFADAAADICKAARRNALKRKWEALRKQAKNVQDKLRGDLPGGKIKYKESGVTKLVRRMWAVRQAMKLPEAKVGGRTEQVVRFVLVSMKVLLKMSTSKRLMGSARLKLTYLKQKRDRVTGKKQLELKKSEQDILDHKARMVKEQMDDALPVNMLKQLAEPARLGGALFDLKIKFQKTVDRELATAKADVQNSKLRSAGRQGSIILRVIPGSLLEKKMEDLKKVYEDFKKQKEICIDKYGRDEGKTLKGCPEPEEKPSKTGARQPPS